MESIKFKDLDSVGQELLRKNNESFYKSKLSDVMERIFIAANKNNGITKIEDEYYMKSGIIPDRIYYIYSDQLNEIAKDKIYDIIIFKDKPCIWFYSKNAINLIGEDPVGTISSIYNVLLTTFKMNSIYRGTFIEKEDSILHSVYCIRLIIFLYETYGILDLEECKNEIINSLDEYTNESVLKFIDHVIKNYENTQYFTKKIYLESYMLLVKK